MYSLSPSKQPRLARVWQPSLQSMYGCGANAKDRLQAMVISKGENRRLDRPRISVCGAALHRMDQLNGQYLNLVDSWYCR